MESRKSHFWLGLTIGSVIGAMAYRFSRTAKAKQLKEKVCHAYEKISGHAGYMLDEAKEKACKAGTRMVDTVADKTYDVAEKVDDMKNKVHNYTDDKK